MKRFIPVICIAAVIAGCGKVDTASKKDSMPVVKGGTVMDAGNAADEAEEIEASSDSGKKDQSENYKPADKAREDEKSQPTTHSAYIAGQRTGDNSQNTSSERLISHSAIPAETVPKPKSPPKKTTAEPPAETAEPAPPRAVFSAALGEILKEGNVPGFGQVDRSSSDITENEFAVADIDGDGAEELIFIYKSDAGTGTFGEIYGIDEEGRLYEKLNVFPAMTFYNNGTLMVDFANTQRPSGGFVSYTLYTPSADGRTYDAVAEVQALDRAEVELIVQEAEAAGTVPAYTYPEEADISGSGKVYYIKPAGSTEETQPCDITEYEVWLSQYTGGASVVYPDYKKLTSENISGLTA